MKEPIINKKSIAIFLLITLISLFTRLYDLTKDGFRMDIYGTAPGDEGAYVHNARNKALFGAWRLEGDLWNPMYISPLFTFFEFMSFKALGVSIFSARLVLSLLGILSVLFVSIMCYAKKREEGIVYFMLLIVNIFLIAYSRTSTLESIVLFFILIILGLIMADNKYAWALAGFFTTFLFFSKITSLFFIASIPLSLIIYYSIYKDKKIIKNFYFYIAGFIFSAALWLFWLVPNFNDWLFMNFGYGERFHFTITKPIGALYNYFQFLARFAVISAVAIVSTFFTLKSFVRKEKINYLDFFLVISLIMFYIQISILDMHLRRFVMILPMLLLMAARFISNLAEFSFSFKNRQFKINRKTTIVLIVLIYALLNIADISMFFFESYRNYEVEHTRLKISQEINKYMPQGSKVYGSDAVRYSLQNGIKPYFSLIENRFVDYHNYTLGLFDKYDFQYAILQINVFDEDSIKTIRSDARDMKVYNHIKNNFKIIATLQSRNDHNNFGVMNIYIYKKIKSN